MLTISVSNQKSYPNDGTTPRRHHPSAAAIMSPQTIADLDHFEMFLKTGFSYSAGSFTNRRRSLTNLRQAQILIVDVDNIEQGVNDWVAYRDRYEPTFIIKSGSHDSGKLVDGEIKNKGAYRAIHLFSRCVSGIEYRVILQPLIDRYSSNTFDKFEIDESTSKNAAAFFYGTCSETSVLYRCDDAPLIDVDQILMDALNKRYNHNVMTVEDIQRMSFLSARNLESFYGFQKISSRHELSRALLLELAATTEGDEEILQEVMSRVRATIRPEEDSIEVERQITCIQQYIAETDGARREPSTRNSLIVDEGLELRRKLSIITTNDRNVRALQVLATIERLNCVWLNRFIDFDGNFNQGSFDLDKDLFGFTSDEWELITPQGKAFLEYSKIDVKALLEFSVSENADLDPAEYSTQERIRGLAGIPEIVKPHVTRLSDAAREIIPQDVFDALAEQVEIYESTWASVLAPLLGVFSTFASSDFIAPELRLIATSRGLTVKPAKSAMPLNLYIMLIGPSSSGKTPLCEQAYNGLKSIAMELDMIQSKEYSKFSQLAARLAAQQKTKDAQRAAELEAMLRQGLEYTDDLDPIEIPSQPEVRLQTSARSPEELVAQCATNERNGPKFYRKDGAMGMCWYSDEASGALNTVAIDAVMRAFLLSFWSGGGAASESIAARSQTGRHTRVSSTALSILFAIQPELLKEMVLKLSGAADPLGFFSRFLYIPVHRPQINADFIEAPDELAMEEFAEMLDERLVQRKFEELYRRYLQIHPRPTPTLAAELSGAQYGKEKTLVPISHEAIRVFKKFFLQLKRAALASEAWEQRLTKCFTNTMKVAANAAVLRSISYCTDVAIDENVADFAICVMSSSILQSYQLDAQPFMPSVVELDNTIAGDTIAAQLLAFAREVDEPVSWRKFRAHHSTSGIIPDDFYRACYELSIQGFGTAIEGRRGHKKFCKFLLSADEKKKRKNN